MSLLASTDVQHTETTGELALNVVVREVRENDQLYYVAECLELPGCLSDGSTADEAKENIQEAMRLCLSVIFEDTLKQLISGNPLPDLRNIVRQGRLSVRALPEVQYA